MAVVSKGRRKIIYQGKKYIWYVKNDDDFFGLPVLNIISDDKKIILAYPLDTDICYIVCKGRFFQNQKTDGKWNRYLVPFEKTSIITPKFVSELIEWAENGKDAHRVEWNGKDIPF